MNNIKILFDESWLKAIIGGTFTDSNGRVWRISWYDPHTFQLFFTPETDDTFITTAVLGEFYESQLGGSTLKN